MSTDSSDVSSPLLFEKSIPRSLFTYDVIIIGSGPSGLFAAFQAGMLDLKCLILEAQDIIGGQCSILYPEKAIYDIPASPNIKAQELIDNLLAQIRPFNYEIFTNCRVIDIQKYSSSNSPNSADQDSTSQDCASRNDVSKDDASKEQFYFEVKCQNARIFRARTILISTGGGAFEPNRPPIENIRSFEDVSVFYQVKDKSLFQDKVIAIAGGGDSAVDWALELFDVAKRIFFIHRRNKFRAAQHNIDTLMKLSGQFPDKLIMMIPYQLHDLEGYDQKIQRLIIHHEDLSRVNLEIDVLLPFFGFKSSSEDILRYELDAEGHSIKVHYSTMETSRSGIFAIGDICSYDGKLKLILSGFSEGAIAMHAIRHYIHQKPMHFEHSTTKFTKLLH